MKKIANNILKKAFRKIDKFLQLEPQEIEKGSALGEEIYEIAEEIKPLVSKKENKIYYRDIIPKLSKKSSKISTDILNSKEGLLSSDWREIARKDHIELKNQILNLQNFLKTHEDVFRRRLYREKFGFDLSELADRLKESKHADSILGHRLAKQLKDMDSDERLRKMEKFSGQLNRISRWLLLLKEVENAG